MAKPILCLDFDGVLHSYTSGWKGANNVPDPPVPGALVFLREAVKHFRVAIYSSRSADIEGRDAMRNWLKWWNAETLQPDGLYPTDDSWLELIEWPTEKPAAMVGIDDRVLTFDGTWPAIETLQNFKPWNKK